MTVQEIITEVRQICQETNPNNSHAADSDIIGWINSAILQICANISTLPKEQLIGIITDDEVNLSNDLLVLDYASILKDDKYYKLESIDFVNFVRLNPEWQNAVRNQPKYFVRLTDLKWMLHPLPTDDWKNLPMTIFGSIKPTSITSTTDTIPLSLALHQAIVHYCAWKFFLLLNNPVRANAEYMTFEMLRRQNMKTATSTTGSMLSFKYRGGV